MGENDEILNEFLIETHEGLDQFEQDLVELEKNPGDQELLGRLFRAIHSAKGPSVFLGLGKLENLTHAGESLLSGVRDGKIQVDEDVTSALLDLADGIRQILSSLESTGAEGANAYPELIARLEKLKEERTGEQKATVEERIEVEAEKAREALERKGASTLRVDVDLLDDLMNLVGELVLTRNRMLQSIVHVPASDIQGAVQALDQLTTELQEGMMKTRMQPLSSLWNKYPRIVRDIALSFGKKVKLDLVGKETEVDRSILEALSEPLGHMLRNSIDHGIETPQARVAAGKTEEGVIRFAAYHEGGEVIIEVSDDGGGIDPEVVRKKAVEKGFVETAKARALEDSKVLDLIFLPGFSSAERVTHLSGRGVGMDVVKANIERISGIVKVESSPGKGTTFRIAIPLTLAIIPALLAEAGGETYAIPQANLLEMIDVSDRQRRRLVEHLDGKPVFRLRGDLLPLVVLADVFGRRVPGPDDDFSIAVVMAENRRYGIIVDAAASTEEIVVKPLGEELQGLGAFSGATILGDGSVVLILDIAGLARLTHASAPAEAELIATPAPAAPKVDKRSLLLFRAGDEERFAVELGRIERLEEFSLGLVERAGDRRVVQYRGGILPLIPVAEAVSFQKRELSDPVKVLVVNDGGEPVGLAVDEIYDILEEAVSVQTTTARQGIKGSTVIEGRVTEMLDLEAVVKRVRRG